MIRITRRTAARTLAAAALLPGALVVSAGLAAADTPNKSQVEYAERRSQEVRDAQTAKARIEYQERLAQQSGTSGSGTSESGTAGSSGSEFPWAVALTGLGVVAAGAGGAVAAVRYSHRHHPQAV